MTDSNRTIQCCWLEGTVRAKAPAGSVKSRRYQPTEPVMLGLEKSPALYAFGTVTGAHPRVEEPAHQRRARPESDGSARYSHSPPSR